MKILKESLMVLSILIIAYVVAGSVIWGYYGVWETYKYYTFYKNGADVYRITKWRYSQLQIKSPKLIDAIESMYVPVIRAVELSYGNKATSDELFVANQILKNVETHDRCMFGYTYSKRIWVLRMNLLNYKVMGDG